MRDVGFIGLGNIGLPAATNLLRAGFVVRGFDLRPTAAFVDAGGRFVATVREVADAEVIIQSLPSERALIETIDALLPAIKPGQVVIEISSYPLEVKRAQAERLSQKGGLMLDCEVSGLPHQVAAKKAVLFKAGDAQSIESLTDIFDAITQQHFYVGEFGAATNMKLIANTMVCVHNLMAAEALNLGRKAGLDPGLMIRVLGPSAAGSATFLNKAPLMLDRVVGAGPGPFRHMFGYLQRADALAVRSAAATPLLNAARDVYRRAEQQGRHDQDIAAIIEIVESIEPEKR